MILLNLKSDPQKIRVVVIGGTLETSLHPIPPVADGAPEWNVFRLAEAAACKPDCSLEIHVISPCETGQWNALKNYPVCNHGNYHHIVFNQLQLDLYRKVLRHILPLRILVRQLLKLTDLMSWWYLKQVKIKLKKLCPHIVIINERPQYIRYLRPLVDKGQLWFFMRGEMGESHRYLGLLDCIVVNSEGMRNYAKQLIKSRTPPIYKMPNTLGEEFTIPIASSDRFNRKEKNIIYTGRLIPGKGVMELLDAFEIVQHEIPDARLLICGASDNFKNSRLLTPYERSLRLRVASMSPEIVGFCGYIPNTLLGNYYSEANLAVFPSLCNESFGMVALEAMRCGIPVVASHQPGFEELILPGETGLLVADPLDVESLAQAIMDILQNPDLAQRMGQAGYQRSLDYTPEKGLQSLESIILNYMVYS